MRRSYASLVGRNFLAALTQLLRSRVLRRSIWAELQALTYLRTLPRFLEDRPEERIVVFDQGPIYLLTRPQLLDKRLARWWAPTFATWSSLLNVVVWLDAPDAVLIERINTRSKVHRVKHSRPELAVEFLARSRAGYDEAIGRLGEQGSGPTILRFDTGRRSAEAVVDEVVATLDRLRPGPDRRSAPSSR